MTLKQIRMRFPRKIRASQLKISLSQFFAEVIDSKLVKIWDILWTVKNSYRCFLPAWHELTFLIELCSLKVEMKSFVSSFDDVFFFASLVFFFLGRAWVFHSLAACYVVRLFSRDVSSFAYWLHVRDKVMWFVQNKNLL